ncbi:putative 2-dehydropantoate 2-reductase [Aporhodopirellula aestuarii]|uniref:2-dehydropantoate 2-reductase n=1 Tax=Aporhodopirellula aestuarii TaxID=2950107 RepID=A0ABT0U0V7_9BACT|nr:putative 2-dehydropantoate 2-reductase [Aporhodopirellula aestuarii]MCM2370461.1 putative 2-dehydropantoate 2-reductase [Aporhodopirellula aestuarii]
MRYAVVGSGAVGGLYGGMLSRGGQDVHFLLRSDFDHVAQHGLRIDSVNGDFVLPKPNIYRRAQDMPCCDVVIVALKSTNNAMLADTLPHLVGEGGVVLTLQNGLDVEADSVAAVPGHGVLGGCCFLCSNKVGPGHIHHLDYGRIVFGGYEFAGRPEEIRDIGQRIVAEMTAAGIDVQWTDDLAAARWRKLMWNVPFNGLSVVLNASTDAIIGCLASRGLADRIIREVYQGAALCGVSIEESAIEKTMRHTETMVPYDSSMRLDYLHGRPMEVEAIFGSPLRAVAERLTQLAAETSEKLPHPMPSVRMLCEQLQFLDSRPAAASNLNG